MRLIGGDDGLPLIEGRKRGARFVAIAVRHQPDAGQEDLAFVVRRSRVDADRVLMCEAQAPIARRPDSHGVQRPAAHRR